MRLQDKLHALKKEFEDSTPKEAVEVMNQATNDLMESDLLKHILGAGLQAPAFTLSGAWGKPVDSRDLLAVGPLSSRFTGVPGDPTAT